MKFICNQNCEVDRPRYKGKGWSLVTGALVLLMPKCAFCWAAYMSLLSSFGVVIKYQGWFLPIAVLLFVLTLIKLLIQSFRKRNFLALIFALVAGLIIIHQRSVPGMDWTKILAIVMMTIAILEEKIIRVSRYVFGLCLLMSQSFFKRQRSL